MFVKKTAALQSDLLILDEPTNGFASIEKKRFDLKLDTF
jgi:hypothetical protein